MLVSLRWLEELLGKGLNCATVKKSALSLGLEVENEEHRAPAGIIIGRVEKISRHPRHKNLAVLEVKADRALQIVTADLKVREKDLVLVGPAGIELAGQKIQAKDFSGVNSQGILVSEAELGLAEHSSGVIILEKGRPGSHFARMFDDLVLDMKATPNRPDWLSMNGIARELSIHLDPGSEMPIDPLKPARSVIRLDRFKVRVKDLQGCPRYTIRSFGDVAVGESPFWMKWRLHCMGMKSINNVVDITNLTMLLTGQPLHPFDRDLLKEEIVVRRAQAGEEFVSLDRTTFKLNKHDLVIADRTGIIALAGVIGAERAQITGSTKYILLESAYFDPRRIAHTSRRLGLITEASTRFERGGDSWAVDQASEQAGVYFKDYAQAKETGFIGLGKRGRSRYVNFSLTRLNTIISTNLNAGQVKSLLKRIEVKAAGKETIRAQIPHYRRDLQIAEDIYEEVARIYGYGNIPETPPRRWASHVSKKRVRTYEEILRRYLVGQGFIEVYNLSMMSGRRLGELGFADFVKIRNPLNERFDALRPSLLPGLLDCVNYNIAKGNRSLKLFEIGNILLAKEPFQKKYVGIIMGGARYPNFWNQMTDLIDYYDAKGVVENIFEFFHVKDVVLRPGAQNGFRQIVNLASSGRDLGCLGSIDPALCAEPFYYIELDLDSLWSCLSEPFYMPPPKFPANTRDLSFLVDNQVAIPAMVDLINKVSGPILEGVRLFDYYKGDNLPPGKKSIGLRLNFRAPDRTLTDQEVDSFVKKITSEVIEKFKADLRTKEKDWTN